MIRAGSLVPGRRGLRARDGRAGADHGPRARHDPVLRAGARAATSRSRSIGPRPGEKLHEELFNPYERPQPTPAQKILRAEHPPLDPAWVQETFDQVNWLVLDGDAAALAATVGELAAVRQVASGARSERRSRRPICLAAGTAPRLSGSAPWSVRVLAPGPGREVRRLRRASPPSSAWPCSPCSTSPRRARSSACANGRAARPSARRSSSSASSRRPPPRSPPGAPAQAGQAAAAQATADAARWRRRASWPRCRRRPRPAARRRPPSAWPSTPATNGTGPVPALGPGGTVPAGRVNGSPRDRGGGARARRPPRTAPAARRGRSTPPRRPPPPAPRRQSSAEPRQRRPRLAEAAPQPRPRRAPPPGAATGAETGSERRASPRSRARRPPQRVGVAPQADAAAARRSAAATRAQLRPAAGAARRAPAPRRAAAPRPGGGRSAGTIALLVGLAVLILGGGAFIGSQLLGGDDEPAPPNQAAEPPAATDEPSRRREPAAASGGGSASTPPKGETNVAVLNGTTFTGLAGRLADEVAGDGYQRGVTETEHARPDDRAVRSSTTRTATATPPARSPSCSSIDQAEAARLRDRRGGPGGERRRAGRGRPGALSRRGEPSRARRLRPAGRRDVLGVLRRAAAQERADRSRTCAASRSTSRPTATAAATSRGSGCGSGATTT